MQMGPQNPLDLACRNTANTLAKLVEVSGMRSPELYFKEITPEIMAQFAAAAQRQSRSEDDGSAGQAQIEQQKAQADAMLAQTAPRRPTSWSSASRGSSGAARP